MLVWRTDEAPGKEPVYCFAMTSDGKCLMSGHPLGRGRPKPHQNFAFHIWRNGKIVQTIYDEIGAVDIKASKDDRFFVISRRDGWLGRVLIPKQTDSTLSIDKAHFGLASERLRRVAISPDSRHVVAIGKHRIFRWDASKGGMPKVWKDLRELNKKAEEQRKWNQSLESCTDRELLDIAFSNDGTRLAVGTKSPGHVVVFDVIQDDLLLYKTLQPGFAMGLADAKYIAWNKEGGYVAAGASNGRLCVSHLSGRGAGGTGSAKGEEITALTYAPDGYMLTHAMTSVNTQRGTVGYQIIFDLNPSRRTDHFPRDRKVMTHDKSEMHTGEITSMYYTKDGHYLVSGSTDGTIKWWEFDREKRAALDAKGK